jgi:predicted RNA binding protein YcfA (HicA-like mRNA interferase family)
MTRLTPVSREELIGRLRVLGFQGPFSGGRHEFMARKGVRLIIPNPHRREVGLDLLARILREAGVTRDEWLGG